MPAVMRCVLFALRGVRDTKPCEGGVEKGFPKVSNTEVGEVFSEAFDKGEDGRMDGHNAPFAGTGFYAALQVSAFQIELHGFKGFDAVAAIYHKKNHPYGRVLLVAPKDGELFFGEGLSFFIVIVMVVCDKLGVVFFDDIIFQGVAVHLTEQFFYVAYAGIA